jgi:hypothetical protein
MVYVNVIVLGQPDLFQVVAALRPAGRFPRRLHGWQQQRGQNGNYCNHYQKFDESEAPAYVWNHLCSLSKTNEPHAERLIFWGQFNDGASRILFSVSSYPTGCGDQGVRSWNKN